MKLIYENDNSDSTIHFKYICEIRMPDPEIKQELWESITTYKDNTDEF